MPQYSQRYEPHGPGLLRIPDKKLDQRTDEELTSLILNPPPVTGEKNLWAFWDKGFASMYPWLKRNVLGWYRRSSATGWTVRVIDLVPGSPNHIHEFVDPKYLPDAFNHGKLIDSYRGQQASDMARLPLIYLHGGVYCDVGTILLRSLDDIFWSNIADDSSPIEFGSFSWAFFGHPAHCLNAFIGSRKQNVLVGKWMDIFLEIWKGRCSAKELRLHPLLKDVPPMPKNTDFEADLDYDAILDYYAQGACFEAIRISKDKGTGWDGLRYIREHVHTVDAFQEAFKFSMGNALPELDGVSSAEQARLLALPYKPDTRQDNVDQATAYRLVNDLLANCSVSKFSAGWWVEGMPKPIAKLWTERGHLDDDITPGTWAEYLRYASEHFEQTRFQCKCLPRIEFPVES